MKMSTNHGGSSKVRFDGLDVQAMVAYLQVTLVGRRIVNIYDGGGNGNETYILKLDGETTNKKADSSKQFLFMESGIRFHTIAQFSGADTKLPTPFCMKLRKHLRGLRLENILQISTDRVVLFQFGVGQYKHCIILELYAKGNLILTDKDYVVLALLRSHVYNDVTAATTEMTVAATNTSVHVQVGQVYPVSYATSLAASSIASTVAKVETSVPAQFSDPNEEPLTLANATVLTMKSVTEFNAWAMQYVEIVGADQKKAVMGKKKKKQSNSSITLKMLLSQNHAHSDVAHYGPALIEHCIRMANLDPNRNILQISNSDDVDDIGPTAPSCVALQTEDEFLQLQSMLRTEGSRIIHCLQDGTSSVGYILYRPMDAVAPIDIPLPPAEKPVVSTSAEQPPPSYHDKILLEFQPILLKQHESLQHLQYQNFATAVEEYFDHMLHQRNAIKAVNAEKNAILKLEKVKVDQQERIESLYAQQDLYERQARTLQLHADDVDKAILVINSAIDSGMSWDQLEQVISIEQQQNRNPIALLIHKLDLENDGIVLRLPTSTEDLDTPEESTSVLDIRVNLRESAYANSNSLFAQYRSAKEKSLKTIEASTKALKAAEETAKRQLIEAQKRSRHIASNTSAGKRKIAWFEKFHWFITTDNYLVIGGRDAHQNELLVKRYLRKGDAYLHADVHGAASCILRAKRRRARGPSGDEKSGTEILPLSAQALREAGNFTICHSAAWTSRIVTSAWWVEAHQVSKTAPTGEYLTVGSFMIRGKKNFLPPTPLEMGLGILFRLGDDDSVARHKNERRDFALLNDEFDIVRIDADAPHAESPERNLTDVAVELEPTEPVSQTPDDDLDVLPDGEISEDDESKPAGDSRCDSDNENVDGNGGDVESDRDISPLEADDGEPAGGPENDDKMNLERGIVLGQSQKRGLSVRDRKLIKKYGSLEAAEKALASNQNRQQIMEQTEETDVSVAASVSQRQSALKRGQKAKLKRVERKYIDQDVEDRKLAMLALQGGEKVRGKKSGKGSSKAKLNLSENQQKIAAETVALLVKDSSVVVNQLPEEVKALLAECVTVPNALEDGTSTIRWDKFDADTLEQLLSLSPLEAQASAAKRLLNLKQSTRIDNFSASLGGKISLQSLSITFYFLTH
jgi:predicted ribosome quality control (RQC) complex YloA/Tae2 family protein